MIKIEKILNRIIKLIYKTRTTEEIDICELKEIMKKENAALIDVRSEQEFNEGHLAGAVLIPNYEINKIKDFVPDKNRIIILYCKSGIRSKKAKNILNKMGYKNVYNLKDGLEGI